jgi:hypothetical protein|tara:strand:+ start:503 stop:760 length:258 start_codon:yes stop_codon:yes gene_type:complete
MASQHAPAKAAGYCAASGVSFIPGFIAVNSATVLGVIVFSYSMFGLVGGLQRKIIDQNRQKAFEGHQGTGKVWTQRQQRASRNHS